MQTQTTPVPGQPQVNYNGMIIHITHISLSRSIFPWQAKDQLRVLHSCLPGIALSIFLAFYLMKSGRLLGLHYLQIFQHLLLITLRQLFSMLPVLRLRLISDYMSKDLACLISSGLLKALSTSVLLQVTAVSFLLAIVTLRCKYFLWLVSSSCRILAYFFLL